MSAFIGKAGKKLFEQHLEKYAPADPLYEYYTNEHGKQKRRKRGLPSGLSARDKRILLSIKKRAHYLDKGFSLCGLRFGWTFFIGLIPIVGDVTDASLNYFLVVRKARQADLPPWLVRRMMMNNAFSAAVGFIPVAGDLVLAMFKANSRNAALLEEYLRIRGEEFLKLNPEGVVEVVPESKFGGFFKRRTGAATKVDAMSDNDIEQVKPGSGLKSGETVATDHSDGNIIDENTTPTSNGKKSISSFFGSKKANTQAPPVGDSGRFIEDVSTTGGAA